MHDEPLAAPSTTPGTYRPAPAQRPGASPSGARRSATARRAPGIIVNYAYLRRDIRYLAVLAPAMVVLLVIAYFVWH